VICKDCSNVQTPVYDSPASLLDDDRREVLAGSNCFLVQFRTRTGSVREISGFATNEVEFGGANALRGPVTCPSVRVRYTSAIEPIPACAPVDGRTLARKSCGHIDSTPDGVVYVAPAEEVWVTAPRDNSVRVLDSERLSQKEKLTFDGRPEGYAVDAKRGRFYLNYEDKDLTTAIDLKTHKTAAKWPLSCGEDGPHGLSFDQDLGFLFVACSTRAEVLDIVHNGEILSSIDTGAGVDDLNYSPATRTLMWALPVMRSSPSPELAVPASSA
jgi:hypothetical protein